MSVAANISQRNSVLEKKGDGRFVKGDAHARAIPLQEVEQKLHAMSLGTLKMCLGTIYRDERSNRMILADCRSCCETRWLNVDNVLSGKTKNCLCRRRVKYGDGRAESLGERYDTMIQRCERGTHVSSQRYKGRGIKVEFPSREFFIFWALIKYPNLPSFSGYEFHRVDNDGNYSQENLRLLDNSDHKQFSVRMVEKRIRNKECRFRCRDVPGMRSNAEVKLIMMTQCSHLFDCSI